MIPGLVEAGGAIIGGLLGSRGGGFSEGDTRRAARANTWGAAAGAIQAAEEFGFNPLTLLGIGGSGAVYGKDYSSMGAGIADAAMYLGDALAKQSDKAKLQQAAEQNQNLQRKVQDLTIRPQVPGIYGPMRMGADNAQAGPAGSFTDPRARDAVALPDGVAGGIGLPERRLDRGSGSFVGGYYLEPAPGWSPANVMEDEYGDLAGSLYGLPKMASDAGHNVGKWLASTQWGKSIKEKYGDKPKKKMVARDAYGRPLPGFEE